MRLFLFHRREPSFSAFNLYFFISSFVIYIPYACACSFFPSVNRAQSSGYRLRKEDKSAVTLGS